MNEIKMNNNEIKIYFIILILKRIARFHLIIMYIFSNIYEYNRYLTI